MDLIHHRREGDLPWEWLGDNPLCPKLCKVWKPSQVQATKSSNVSYIIRILSLESCMCCGCGGLNNSDKCGKP